MDLLMYVFCISCNYTELKLFSLSSVNFFPYTSNLGSWYFIIILQGGQTFSLALSIFLLRSDDQNVGEPAL